MNKTMIYAVGRSIFAVLALVFLLVRFGGGRESRTAMVDVEQAVCSQLDLSMLQKADAQMIWRFYGINPKDYTDVVLYAPVSNMGAEELLIVRLKDRSQARALKDAVEERRQTQIGIFEGYAPQQTAMLQNSYHMEVRGGYLLYVVHSDPARAAAAFRAAL